MPAGDRCVRPGRPVGLVDRMGHSLSAAPCGIVCSREIGKRVAFPLSAGRSRGPFLLTQTTVSVTLLGLHPRPVGGRERARTPGGDLLAAPRGRGLRKAVRVM